MTENKSSSNDILLRNYHCKRNETKRMNEIQWNNRQPIEREHLQYFHWYLFDFPSYFDHFDWKFSTLKTICWIFCTLPLAAEVFCLLLNKKFVCARTNFTPLQLANIWQIVAYTQLPLAVCFSFGVSENCNEIKANIEKSIDLKLFSIFLIIFYFSFSIRNKKVFVLLFIWLCLTSLLFKCQVFISKHRHLTHYPE